jgi:hypothetical protein
MCVLCSGSCRIPAAGMRQLASAAVKRCRPFSAALAQTLCTTGLLERRRGRLCCVSVWLGEHVLCQLPRVCGRAVQLLPRGRGQRRTVATTVVYPMLWVLQHSSVWHGWYGQATDHCCTIRSLPCECVPPGCCQTVQQPHLFKKSKKIFFFAFCELNTSGACASAPSFNMQRTKHSCNQQLRPLVYTGSAERAHSGAYHTQTATRTGWSARH